MCEFCLNLGRAKSKFSFFLLASEFWAWDNAAFESEVLTFRRLKT